MRWVIGGLVDFWTKPVTDINQPLLRAVDMLVKEREDHNVSERSAKHCQNKGLACRIFEGSDAKHQLQGFYEEVSSPLLLEVDLRYPENAVDLLTHNHYSQLLNSSEIVVAGLLTNNDPDNFLVLFV
ncbi:inter-alpha-trypsin inhibitor heavy chain H3-like [Larimichthys crocea]|uniref:inter-alpha-trypsin inhibitor heavy chain H3-like n=1 Tax=Larimichthys crocea TaxID=215358 RepID=UPI000F5FABF0|nr:inter-alpha-trypsin inhibitor heavy chain H3-like [Larimichthys crocea]